MTIINTVAIIFFLLFIVYLYNKSSLIIPAMIPLLLTIVINVISSAYIEEGIYVVDIFKYSYMTGGTIRMIILYIVFLMTILLRYKRNGNKLYRIPLNRISGKNQIRILVGATIVVFYLLLDIIISGSILTNTSINRFNYLSTYSRLPLISTVSAFRNPMAYLCGLVFIDAKRIFYKVYSVLILVALIFSWLLIGNQFFGILYLGIYFTMPLLIVMLYRKEHIVNFKNFVLGSIIVVISLIPKLSFFQKHTIYGLDSNQYNTAFSLLLYRAFGLQSNVWWEIDRQIWEGGKIDLQHTFTEFASFFRLEKQINSGIYYLMNRAMPSSEYQRYIDGNGTLCSGHPALEVAMWGYIGAFFAMMIEAILFYSLTRALTKATIKKNIIDCLVLVTLMFEVLKAFTVGGFFWLTNTIPLICYAYLIITKVFKVRVRLKV